MAEILSPTKPLSVNPLKASQPIGASLAFMGLADCMPLEHGARGCTSFNKLFFMRHFNEPIPLQTTAMDQTTTVLGADDNVVEALTAICARNKPRAIGLVTTGLSEMQGADVPRTVQDFRKKHPEHAGVAIVPVSASDTLGCLETGFAAAVEALIRDLVPHRLSGAPRKNHQINILASALLSPGDLDELRDLAEIFGLDPIVLPDIGLSLDGHLIDQGFSTLTYGGTEVSTIERMADSVATLTIGRSLDRAAELMAEKTGAADVRLPHLTGLAASDRLIEVLADISGQEKIPAKILRQRERLADAMVDCQFQFGGAKIGIAADADILGALTDFFTGMGAHVVAAVASARAPRLAELPVETVIVGDLEDFESLVRDEKADLIVTNSHGAEISRRTGAAFLRAGFPVYDRYGVHAESSIGYVGTRRLVFEAANLLGDHFQELAPYVSRFRSTPPSQAAE